MTRLAGWIAELRQDLRYASRSLAASPGFAISAIVTIALGVGVNTGVFSVLNAVAFRDLPAGAPSELVAVNQDVQGVPRGRNNAAQFSTAEYEAYRDEAKTLNGVLAYGRLWSVVLGRDDPHQVIAAPVSCNYFDVLQRVLRLGRGFTAAHCASPADADVAVITHELWVERYGSDPSILERTVTINGTDLRIVGVAPEGFNGIDVDRPSLFVPLTAQQVLGPDRNYLDDAALAWLNLVGRKNAGVSTRQVQAELGVIGSRFDLEQPGRRTTVSVSRATALSAPSMRTGVLGASAVVMTAFGLVLLVACSNVANLLLARADSRARETAIRLSLGATPARLVRQFLTESTLIALIGGMLGALLAVWAFRGVAAAALSALPSQASGLFRVEPELDLRVLGFALAASLIAGIGFGLTPALAAARPRLRMAIERGSPGSGQPATTRLQSLLVGAQVAFSMVLVVTTALLLRALYTAQTIDPAFDHERLVVASAEMRSFGYDAARAAALQTRAADEIRGLPGVEDVAQASFTPLEPRSRRFFFRLPADERDKLIDVNNVSANYFSVTGIPIVRGRTFTAGEIGAAQLVSAIVTESTANALWPDRDPLGQTLIYEGFGEPRPLEVIGIARDVEVATIGETSTSYVYLPALAPTQPEMQLVIRTALPANVLKTSVDGVFHAIDPALPVSVRPVSDNFEFWAKLSRVAASLSFGLGALALTLASVGVFGVMSTIVGRRLREIGIRRAFGASKSDVLELILRKALRPVLVGAAIGTLACFGVTRLLAAVLFGVGTLDPLALGGAVATMAGAAFLAATIPARRALSIDPMVTLRYE